jgi:hypothetical protein
MKKQTPLNESFKHIQKRSHLFELKLTLNPDYDELGGTKTGSETSIDSK